MSIIGALANDGTVELDFNPLAGTASSLTVAGALTNSGSLNIGYGGTLDVTSGVAGSAPAGSLSGDVQLSYNGAIEFNNGQISTIGASSTLSLFGSYGNTAFIEDSTALGSNSALTGLADVAGSLYLDNGESVSTTGALANSGLVSLGSRERVGGERFDPVDRGRAQPTPAG